jgi:arylsulfatase A-like enzyme
MPSKGAGHRYPGDEFPSRRRFLAWAGAAGAGWFATSLLGGSGFGRLLQAQEPAQAPVAQPTNVVILFADDLGYAGVGCTGCTDIPTPNVDSIAKNGVRFTNGYVAAPLCAPSRAGLLTGRYQQRFGFEHNPGPEQHASPKYGVPRSETMLAERFKGAGHATGMVGKWHVGFAEDLRPPARGFDEFYGFLGGAHTYFPQRRRRAGDIYRGNVPGIERQYLTDAWSREAVAFIERHKDAPFLLYLPFNAVHTPLEAPEKYLSRFPSMREGKRRTHAAMVTAMDDAIGAVLGKLREHNLMERTLVVFLSDNGGPTSKNTSSNAPLRGYKAQMWEGGIRIPFMAQWDGKLPAGKLYESPVISLDILPTACAAAGIAIPAEAKLDGVDLMPFLTGATAGKPHEDLFWRMGKQWAVRSGDWKLVMTRGTSEPWLVDLAADVSETTDLAAKNPEKAKELRAKYDAWSSQLMEPRWQWGEGAKAGAKTPEPEDQEDEEQKPDEGKGEEEDKDPFRLLDKDGDGRLSRDEVPPRLSKYFDKADADKDGFLSREEFLKALGGG